MIPFKFIRLQPGERGADGERGPEGATGSPGLPGIEGPAGILNDFFHLHANCYERMTILTVGM